MGALDGSGMTINGINTGGSYSNTISPYSNQYGNKIGIENPPPRPETPSNPAEKYTLSEELEEELVQENKSRGNRGAEYDGGNNSSSKSSGQMENPKSGNSTTESGTKNSANSTNDGRMQKTNSQIKKGNGSVQKAESSVQAEGKKPSGSKAIESFDDQAMKKCTGKTAQELAENNAKGTEELLKRQAEREAKKKALIEAEKKLLIEAEKKGAKEMLKKQLGQKLMSLVRIGAKLAVPLQVAEYLIQTGKATSGAPSRELELDALQEAQRRAGVPDKEIMKGEMGGGKGYFHLSREEQIRLLGEYGIQVQR